MSKLSLVIPVYYNELNLNDLYLDIKSKILSVVDDYELIFVDDDSKDRSLEILKELKKIDHKIKIVKLSRNFGSHAAILAGINYASGDCVAMKTADLQEPSEIIVEMYNLWKKGNNVVLAIREKREDSFISRFFSNSYYNLVRKIAIKNMPKGGFDCFLIDKKVVEVLRIMDEKNSTLMGQILWSGFKTEFVYYTRLKRKKGKSKWTLIKKIKLFTDSILSFSFVPIRFVTILGIFIELFTIIYMGFIMYARFNKGIGVEGWTALMLINLFFFGLIFLTLGIIGEYIWRILDACRSRPTFIVEDVFIDKEV